MWPFKKNLKDVLNQTKKIKINGVLFEIKKIDMLDYLDGSQVMYQLYNTYEEKKSIPEVDAEKIRKHMIDVIMAGVVKPRLSRKDEGEVVCVEEIFRDQQMASDLYSAIIEYTYSKKKLNI